MTAEELRLHAQLANVFLGQGFGETNANLLASADIDPADSTRLVRRGCSHELAARILL